MLRQKDLIDLISYDKETGIFKWRKKRRGIKTGVPLGADNGFGYLRIIVLGKSYYAHRLAWLYMTGEWPKNEIDHINGIKNDNRFENLREVTRILNAQNKLTAPSHSKTRVIGVSWHKKAKKWQAHICILKKRKYLGLFENIEDARNEYLKHKKEISYVSA